MTVAEYSTDKDARMLSVHLCSHDRIASGRSKDILRTAAGPSAALLQSSNACNAT